VQIGLQFLLLGRRVRSVPLHKPDRALAVEDKEEANHRSWHFSAEYGKSDAARAIVAMKGSGPKLDWPGCHYDHVFVPNWTT
jgi:hypothetical protein